MLTPELIEDWTKSSDHIIVTPAEEGAEDIVIDRDSFELWADKNDKREWGDLEGDTGRNTWEEYYEGSYITADLCEYIEVKKLGDKATELITDLLKP